MHHDLLKTTSPAVQLFSGRKEVTRGNVTKDEIDTHQPKASPRKAQTDVGEREGFLHVLGSCLVASHADGISSLFIPCLPQGSLLLLVGIILAVVLLPTYSVVES